ncbi:transglycosylase domain-containing protein [Candidatus Oscillochloris fontis]|uniref:transglycosylase domain-containing protein n=1 Tax=Candidatus Oscillochloris fontis TaxID=2496868 RepID=UPI00101D5922|nr:PBP1A family penicillin-binding protein [Candidatus Oscillochloris fontis]
MRQRPSPPHFIRRPQPRREGTFRQRYPLLAFLGRLVLALLKLSLLAALALVAFGAWLYHHYGSDLPNPDQISEYRNFETTRIYARDGTTLLYELVGPDAGRRTPVPFEQIPLILRQATVAVEDAGFYENPGVDLRGIVRAAWQNYQSGEIVSGASTITQQLVRTILLDPSERSERSYERKLREAILAYRVSREYSKDQILTIYLNEVYYGAQAYGVEAAAQAYFNKHVGELSAAEATLIAGLPQSPTTYNPFENMEAAKARQRVTLNLMVEAGYLSAAQAEEIAATPITLNPPQTNLLAPHFAFYVRDILEQRYGPDLLYRAGLRVVTSLDLTWQTTAQQVAQQRVAELRERNVSNAGVVILTPDGQILAMVGSVDYSAPDGQVNVTLARRQPGSALKPFVYALALQRGWTPATVIWDTPSEWRMPDGVLYAPRNYDDTFHGPLSLRMSLANSLNIPAVKALEFVGVGNFIELMSRLGVTTFDDPSRYGLAMALGSNEVRLLELTGAYNGLRNAGHATPPVAILNVTNSRGAVLERWTPQRGPALLGPSSEAIAYLISHILSDNQARWFMFGRNNVLELPDMIVAAKTGTSNDWRDSWALGYTSEVTMGVWVGNNDGSPMTEVAGSNGAGFIWRDLMLAYHQQRPTHPFSRPPSIEEVLICGDTGGRAGEACPRPISELFVAGTAPTTVDVVYQMVRVGGDGTCLAQPYTPTDQVREVQYAIYPPEFREWAARNVPQPPTKPCPPPLDPTQAVALLNPIGDAGRVRGSQIFISGTARGPFSVEYGAGSNPEVWKPISQGATPVENGLLGVWSLGGLPPGPYSIRLRVIGPSGATVSAQQMVQVE